MASQRECVGRRASGVGVPATATVGCIAAIRSSEVEPSLSVPSRSVARCHRLGSFTAKGISLVASTEVCGRSGCSTLCTANSCSSPSLVLVAKVSAASWSTAASVPEIGYTRDASGQIVQRTETPATGAAKTIRFANTPSGASIVLDGAGLPCKCVSSVGDLPKERYLSCHLSARESAELNVGSDS